MPSLIAKHQEKQRVTQLKKVYSILSQAYLMAKSEYGEADQWGLVNTDTNKNDSDGNPIYDYSGQNTVKNYLGKYIRQSQDKKQHKFKKFISLDGREFEGLNNMIKGDSIIFLADGTIVKFGYTSTDCKNIDISCGDISVFFPASIAKMGLSNFWFYLSPKGIMPYGHPNHTRKFEDYCDIKNKKGLASSIQGRSCTAWVLYNENMDYLHCDDLSWQGKRKCK